jgi:cytidine deaminase
VIFEFSQVSGIDIEVIMATTDMKKIIISTINELLPLGFGPADLGK